LLYIVVGAAFAAIVIYSGGIMIGHKENHQAVIHIPQMYYFAVYACVFFATVDHIWRTGTEMV
jgi:alpha-1,2-glucosyltransferase